MEMDSALAMYPRGQGLYGGVSNLSLYPQGQGLYGLPTHVTTRYKGMSNEQAVSTLASTAKSMWLKLKTVQEQGAENWDVATVQIANELLDNYDEIRGILKTKFEASADVARPDGSSMKAEYDDYNGRLNALFDEIKAWKIQMEAKTGSTLVEQAALVEQIRRRFETTKAEDYDDSREVVTHGPTDSKKFDIKMAATVGIGALVAFITLKG